MALGGIDRVAIGIYFSKKAIKYQILLAAFSLLRAM
jgi:hypothetical protein